MDFISAVGGRFWHMVGFLEEVEFFFRLFRAVFLNTEGWIRESKWLVLRLWDACWF